MLKRYSAPSPEPAPKRISLFDGEVDYYGADTADAPVKGERDIPPQAMVFYDERTNDYLATKDRADEGKRRSPPDPPEPHRTRIARPQRQTV